MNRRGWWSIALLVDIALWGVIIWLGSLLWKLASA